MAALPLFLVTAGVMSLSACTASNPTDQASVSAAPAPAVVSEQTNAPASVMTTSLSETDATIFARLSRLEADVGSIKTQMNQIGPVLEKMPALQDKLSELVSELQRIDARVVASQHSAPASVPVSSVGPAPSVAKPVTEPAPVPMQKPTVASTQVHAPTPELKPVPAMGLVAPTTSSTVTLPILEKTQTSGPAHISDVRIGDYPDKTRIVVDVSDKTAFTTDLDNTEHVFMIDVSAPDQVAIKAAEFSKSPLIASYHVQAVDGGKSRVIIQLRKDVKILSAQPLPPNSERGHRIVVDLGPL